MANKKLMREARACYDAGMLKAVMFDVDGTLGDTLPLCIETYRRITEEVTGRRPEVAEVTGHFGLSDRGVLGKLVGMEPDDPALPVRRMVEIYEELHPAMAPAPFPGAVEMLRAVRVAGMRIGIISGKEAHTAAPTLRFFGLDALYDWAAFGLPDRNVKAERLLEAMQVWNLQPHELVYVGDAPSDITMAHHAGVRVVNAAWAPGAAQEEQACLALKPDHRLTDMAELLPLLLKL